MNLNYQMVILCQIFKVIFNISWKSTKLTEISPIHVYINRVNNKLVFTIKDEYKLELPTPETMKLFDSTKKLIDKPKNRKNMLSLEGGEVVLVLCNLVDNQYKQKSKVLFNFRPNKSFFIFVGCWAKQFSFFENLYYNTGFDKNHHNIGKLKWWTIRNGGQS